MLDPDTLRAFLKIIDEFNYDHSERLDDAFEYMLSVLDSRRREIGKNDLSAAFHAPRSRFRLQGSKLKASQREGLS